MKQYAPLLVVPILAIIVSYNIFSRRPSKEEFEKMVAEKEMLKENFDQSMSGLAFTSVIEGRKRTVTKGFVANTTFEVKLSLVGDAVRDTTAVPFTTDLYDVSNPQDAYLKLAGLEGRKVKSGDTLRKYMNDSFLILSRPGKDIQDTLEFSWKLF
ncbi:MAG: hypothetical protein AAF824_02960 [Bacteroidota bacterium]